jgi:hypothetical protein
MTSKTDQNIAKSTKARRRPPLQPFLRHPNHPDRPQILNREVGGSNSW